jgi:hypothetical protein
MHVLEKDDEEAEMVKKAFAMIESNPTQKEGEN